MLPTLLSILLHPYMLMADFSKCILGGEHPQKTGWSESVKRQNASGAPFIYILMRLTCLFNQKWTIFPHTHYQSLILDCIVPANMEVIEQKTQSFEPKACWRRDESGTQLLLFLTHFKNTSENCRKVKPRFLPPFTTRNIHNWNCRAWGELGAMGKPH